MVTPIYKYSGTAIGFRSEDGSVFGTDGGQIGRFVGDELFNQVGSYVGELKNGILCANPLKSRKRQGGFVKKIGKPFHSLPNIFPKPVPLGYRNIDDELLGKKAKSDRNQKDGLNDQKKSAKASRRVPQNRNKTD
jgi:hypothetical protein